MSSPFGSLERPPLRANSLRRSLIRPGSLWSEINVVERTGSTNADLRVAALQGAGEGTVLIAEEQLAGRGRLDRSWTAPARSALTLSVLLRPPSPAPTPWGWLPLLAAVAVDDALRRFEVADSGVKWPNDVLLGEKKLAGVLSERVDGSGQTAVVIGMGVNVSLDSSELPSPGATSLVLAGEMTDREGLAKALLRAVEVRYRQWRAGEAERVRSTYLKRSISVGRQVHVQLPGGAELRGTAIDVDRNGSLVVDDGHERHRIAAADVTHARLKN